MPMGRIVGRPSSASKSVRWSPAQKTSASGAVPSEPERTKDSRSTPSVAVDSSSALRCACCQSSEYPAWRSRPVPPVSVASVGSHSPKSPIQPSAPSAIAAFILPTAHATAAGCVRSTIDAVASFPSMNV